MAKETKEEQTWMPSLKWLIKAFAIILVCIIIAFFVFNYLLKPYMRDIPMELTPWLDKSAITGTTKN